PPLLRSTPLADVAGPVGDDRRRPPAMAVAARDRPRRGLAGLASGRRTQARGRGQHRVVLPRADAAMAPAPGPRKLRRAGRGPVRVRARVVGAAGPDRAPGADRGP